MKRAERTLAVMAIGAVTSLVATAEVIMREGVLIDCATAAGAAIRVKSSDSRQSTSAVNARIAERLASVTASAPAASSPDSPAAGVLLWTPYFADHADIPRYGQRLLLALTRAYANRIPALYASNYAAGIPVTVRYGTSSSPADLPESLDPYAMVFVMLPYDSVTANQVAKLKSVVGRGGRIVLQGEFGGYVPVENAVLTRLAADMGADFKIGTYTESAADTFNLSADLLKNPVQLTLADLPRSDCVAPITYWGAAEQIAQTVHYVWAVDEVSGNGRITVFSDANWYFDSDGTDYLDEAALPFLERLLSNAIACEQKVIDEEDPNEDIGEKIPDGMVAAVRDENDYLTYYATVAAACTAACADRDATNRLTVVLKRDIRESFTLPVGVTFETAGVTTNYDREAAITVDAGVLLSVNAAHDVYYASTAALPGSPTVTATDGSYTNRVRVSWTVPDSDLPVTAYHVWRVKVGSTLVTELTNSVTGLSYEDRTAKPGVRYTYYVSAYSSAGWGFEGSDEGWRSVSAVGGVADVTARQRYPWNGKVDVDFDVTGDADVTYRVGLTVLDVAGGTNLPVKTVLGETLVAPGRHRLVWDADADIAADGELPQLKVSVAVEEE